MSSFADTIDQILIKIESNEITPEEGYERINEMQLRNDFSSVLHCETEWQISDLLSNPTAGWNESVLLFDRGDNFHETLLQKNAVNSEMLTVVKPGPTFCEMTPGQLFEINPAIPEDYVRLFESLKKDGKLPGTIIHLWTCHEASTDIEPAKLSEQLTLGVYSIFYLSQALLQYKQRNPVQLFYVYLTASMAVYPPYAAVSGIGKSIYLENNRYLFKTIGINFSDAVENNMNYTETLYACLTNELGRSNPEAFEVLYAGRKRYVKRVIPINNKEILSSKPTVLRTQGVYLITGGAGGLGFLFAEYIAKTVNATIILVGRSRLTAQQMERIGGLNNSGSQIIYRQADISKQQDVVRLISGISEQYGDLNGIIHSAGVVQDALLLHKTKKDFDNVLAPKIYGTVWLDQAVRSMQMDFFTLFSSITSVIGNVGQADYAAANTFMDAYAHMRMNQQASTLYISLNWPLWEDGGMTVDPGTLDAMKQSWGMVPLQTSIGLKSFESSIAYGVPQWIVMEGNSEKLCNVLISDNTPFMSDEAEPSVQPHPYDYQEYMEIYLKEVLSQETKLPMSRIDVDVTFDAYGIDSVMIMNVTRTLEKQFRSLPKTLFFEYKSIKELAAYFAEKYSVEISKHFSSNNEAVTVPEMRPAVLEKKPLNAAQNIVGRRSTSRPASLTTVSESENQEIAIIGIAGRYPMADHLFEFWDNLKAGRDCITEIPSDRWDYRKYYDAIPNTKNKINSKWGGFIRDFDKFDPLFFSISPKEAKTMDPQERLFLETAWHCVEDAGYTKKTLQSYKAGVFVGVMFGNYQLYGAEESLKGNRLALNSSFSSIANRVSYIFDFKGPSMAIDTMCSSSLTAIHLACDSIRKGECDIAVAGGVNVSVHPNKYMLLHQSNFLSSDGKCRSFGDGGDGYVPGEGVGAILIKSLDQAVRDNDHIYAVIRSSSLNHGGKTNGYTVPNPLAQSSLLVETMRKANIDPRTISYIEAHGTGTALGDPIEVSGLNKAFRTSSKEVQSYCSVGSVKSNIGHLESAAGIAGLTKVVLQMRHKQLVPSLHSQELNANIDFNQSPFYIQQKLSEWKQPRLRMDGAEKTFSRRAGISSFGAGGSNAHIILEEYQGLTSGQRWMETDQSSAQLFVLSAKNKKRLKEYAKSLCDFLCMQEDSGQGISIEPMGISAGVIHGKLASLMSDIIEVDSEHIGSNDSLEEYGMDPLQVVQFTESILQTFHVHIDPEILYDIETIGALTEYISLNTTLVNGTVNNHLGNTIVSSSEELTLSDIAYTLQVGREAMDSRLAIIASSKRELINYLNIFSSEGDDCSDSVYYGDINEEKLKSLLFLNGSEGDDFLRLMLKQRKWEKLAQLWTTGIEFDWELLNETHEARKVSLPGYPFVKERHWFAELEGEFIPDKARTQQTRLLHPLIHENVSDMVAYRYRTAIQKSAMPIMNRDSSFMSGFMYLEIARAAVNLANREKALTSLKEVRWSIPLSLNDKLEELNVYTELIPVKDETLFEVTSQQSQVIVHCQGKICEITHEKQEPINITSIMKRCQLQLTDNQYYDNVPSWFVQNSYRHRVQAFNCNADEVIAKVQLPNRMNLEKTEYGHHLQIWETILQIVNVYLYRRGNEKSNICYFPSAVEAISYNHHIETDGGWIYIVQEKDLFTFNLCCTDLDGHIWLSMDQLTVKPYTLEIESVPVNANVERLYFNSRWSKTNFSVKQEVSKRVDRLLIFDHDANMADQIKRQVRASGTILVMPGELFVVENANTIRIRPHHREDYSSLLLYLSEQGMLPTHVVHGWSRLSWSLDQEIMNTQLYQSFYSMAYLSQSLMEQGIDRVCLNYVYDYEGGYSQPIDGAISGLLRSITLENPNFSVRSIGFNTAVPNYENQRILNLLQELYNEDKQEIEIKYDGKERFVNDLKEYTAQTSLSSAIPQFRKYGVYVITGGLGGLGRILARTLAKDYQAKLILVGRSPLEKSGEMLIMELNDFGAEAVYIQADVNQVQGAQTILREAKSRFQAIHGIIHSAGVYRDGFLIRKSHEDMKQVIDPKVNGTVSLDIALANERLDFFVMFSSLAGVLGKVGQSDYAFGNCFLDHFAAYRDYLRSIGKRQGLTLSIDWPLWLDGGMQLSELEISTLEETAGLQPLPTVVGIESFMQLLQSNAGQALAVFGHSEKMRDYFLKKQSYQRTTSMKKMLDQKDLLEKTERFIRELIAEEIGLEESLLDSYKGFDQYGIDSIVINSFNVKIEKSLGPMPKTMLFEHRNIHELSQYLLKSYSDQLLDHFVVNTSGGPEYLTEESTSDTVWKVLQRFGDLKHDGRDQSTYNQAVRDVLEDEIAIVGVSGSYPEAETIEEYWDNLLSGKDCIVEIPNSRWNYRELYDENPDKSQFGKMYCKYGGFLRDIDKFDPLFFNISPREAETMDPQERLFLQCAWAALEDAGYSTKRLQHMAGKERSANVGVFVGVTTNSYQQLGARLGAQGELVIPNSMPWSIPNRVSYTFNFSGPSIPVDTACSSSLTALHLACESLKKKECKVAITGGVNLYLDPNKYIAMSQLRMLSATGRCQSFGANSDGFVPGEGVGAIVLKPLKAALADRDQIYGIVKASAMNHGGKTNGYSVPSPIAQAEVISHALKQVNMNPRTISYIEAHGTGTALGDPIEIAGLTKSFREYTQESQFCSIGSAKSNIGHLESAAGIAGITKILLQMKYKTLVPSLHSKQLNRNIQFMDTPFWVQQEAAEWKQPILEEGGQLQTYPRRAGISSFGAGGANVHIILEEYDSAPAQNQSGNQQQQLVVLSAKGKEQLHESARRLLEHIQRSKMAPKPKNEGPNADKALEALKQQMPSMISPAILNRFQQAFETLDSLIQELLWVSLRELGAYKDKNEAWSNAELKKHLKISEEYDRMFDALLEIVLETGFIRWKDAQMVPTPKASFVDPKDRYKEVEKMKLEIIQQYPEIEPHIHLIWTCVVAYSKVLTGETNHMDVMFPGGKIDLVEKIYKGNVLVDYFNRLVADFIKETVQSRLLQDSNACVRILEIGAGTGGTSKFVLDALKPYVKQVEYYYTDISVSFTKHGKKVFGPEFPTAHFSVLNIEESPEKQGYDNNSYDIIFASNVIHTTKDISKALKGIQSLLKQKGILLINEITRRMAFATLTFGITSGWWRFEDGQIRIKHSPLLTPESWINVLREHEFEISSILGFPYDDLREYEQHVVIAVNNEELVNGREDYSFSLNQMAYTLQTGREEMKERIAFTAVNMQECIEHLQSFIDGDGDDTAFYRSNGKAAHEILMQDTFTMHSALRDKRYDLLAQLWVNGASIEWEQLYSSSIPNIISLPTYPFLKDRYWLPEKPANKKFREDLNAITSIHTLLDSNESTFACQSYKKTFYADDAFLEQHVVQGKRLLAGTLYLEMAIAAGRHASQGQDVIRIKDIVWGRPFQLTEGYKDLFVQLNPRETEIQYELISYEDEGMKTIHSNGKIFVGEHIDHDEYVDLSIITTRCSKNMTQDQCYTNFIALGYHYGSIYRTIQGMHCGSQEGIAQLSLHESLHESWSQFICHPILLDGVLQSAIGLVETRQGYSVVPFSIDEVELRHPIPESCYVHIHCEPRHGDSIQTFTMTVTDLSGKVCVKIKRFSLRVLRADSYNESLQETYLLSLFKQLVEGEIEVEEVELLTGGIANERSTR